MPRPARVSPVAGAPPDQLSLFDRLDQAFPGARPTLPKRPMPVAATAAGLVHPQATHRLQLGPLLLGYQLKRAARRSIGFVVRPEGLSVTAPRWVRQADIEDALRHKADWVLRKLQEQQERLRRQGQARVAWGEGAELPYLGAPLRLRLDAGLHGVRWLPALLAGQAPQLCLGLPADTPAKRLREVVQAWLQQQALALFHQRCAQFAPQLGVQPRRVRLSAARTRWGSASADGNIRLNWRLIHLPLDVIDYVVVHELAHLREMNHSPAFWALVQAVLPDMQARRAALRHPVLPPWDDDAPGPQDADE
ncbi:M48 family metallopeptidase [Ideonella livida]|uniref:M48 family metallopeptidase n=1 Tax=Ideonella livida TaxID=2707176 RepID=A0A7C9PGV6_9BURK|nr:SprT family zinc-dependent metalloprotease [Ideonella livida]NDY91191.1 M48 family metallopeptidase [Ideonella livida]